MELLEMREMRRLLTKLTADERVGWLRWCCRQVSQPGFAGTKIVENDGGVESVLWDAISLKATFGLSLELMGQKLVRLVHGK